uniref:START domain-containing protein n=1 Tax=Heterorhabditis bacteriophora TaxID=37862 RepID=A0A1I7X120_HETBA
MKAFLSCYNCCLDYGCYLPKIVTIIHANNKSTCKYYLFQFIRGKEADVGWVLTKIRLQGGKTGEIAGNKILVKTRNFEMSHRRCQIRNIPDARASSSSPPSVSMT